MTALLQSWIARQARRFRRSDSGATAVEFAIVAGPFFYVLGCICETGLMLFSEYVIQNSVQEAARMVRTGQVSASDGSVTMSVTDFKAKICEQVSIIIDCEGKVSVYVNNASNFGALIINPLDGGPGSGWRSLQTHLFAWRPAQGGNCRCHL